MWGAFSDQRTSLSFTIAAGPRQRSQSRVLVPWDSRPYVYFTVSDSRLPFSSPPMTRRATVEVFDSASTRRLQTCPRWFLARGFFYPEDGGDTFLRNVGSHKNYTAPHPRKRHSSTSVLFPRKMPVSHPHLGQRFSNTATSYGHYTSESLC
jgi:hypothetical protein